MNQRYFSGRVMTIRRRLIELAVQESLGQICYTKLPNKYNILALPENNWNVYYSFVE